MELKQYKQECRKEGSRANPDGVFPNRLPNSRDGLPQKLALRLHLSSQRLHSHRKPGLQVRFGFGVRRIDSCESNAVRLSLFVQSPQCMKHARGFVSSFSFHKLAIDAASEEQGELWSPDELARSTVQLQCGVLADAAIDFRPDHQGVEISVRPRLQFRYLGVQTLIFRDGLLYSQDSEKFEHLNLHLFSVIGDMGGKNRGLASPTGFEPVFTP